jgi:hypothetical protein
LPDDLLSRVRQTPQKPSNAKGTQRQRQTNSRKTAQTNSRKTRQTTSARKARSAG